MAKEIKPYDDPLYWEYDCGSSTWTGNSESLSPAMKKMSDEITREVLSMKKEDPVKKIILELDDSNFYYVLRQYGPDGAKAQAISMCMAAGRPITRENLEGLLTNLEEALEENFMGGTDDPQ